MTEVFESWAAERLQKPQQHTSLPSSVSHPSSQLHQSLQPQQQAAYYYNSTVVAELPPGPGHGLPVSIPLTHNIPLRGHADPALPPSISNNAYAYQEPAQRAVETPIELPDNHYMAPSIPMPARSISTEVSRLASLTHTVARGLTGCRRRKGSCPGYSESST